MSLRGLVVEWCEARIEITARSNLRRNEEIASPRWFRYTRSARYSTNGLAMTEMRTL